VDRGGHSETLTKGVVNETVTYRSAGLIALASHGASGQANNAAGWITLFDGKNLSAFNMTGDANWQLMDGVVQANKGTGFLCVGPT
jgi:hypothetical protein